MKSPLTNRLRKQTQLKKKATRACELAKHTIYDRKQITLHI